MTRAGILAALVLAAVAGPAGAIVVQSAADAASAVPNRATDFGGVVGIIVRTNAQVAALGGAANYCTGAVVGTVTVLTAAHCFDNTDGSGIASVRVYTPDLNQPRAPSILASTFYAAPGYTGDLFQGYDIGIVKLSRAVPIGTPIYELDHGSVASNLGVEVGVGIGLTGVGATGATGGIDGRKRAGFNEYEFLLSDILAAAGAGVAPGSPTDINGAPIDGFLVSDFDSGLAQNDVFGRYLGTPGLGVSIDGFHDTSSAFGDSGGPHFRNGKIVGITSFGVSGTDVFEDGRCGRAGRVDPSFAFGTCANASFGEINVDTRVSAYYDYIASHVPEPASWGLMIAGFGVVGGTLRRGRSAASNRA